MDVFYLPSPAESYITVECATAKSNYNSSISYSRSPSAEIVEDEIDRSNVAEGFTMFALLSYKIEFSDNAIKTPDYCFPIEFTSFPTNRGFLTRYNKSQLLIT